MLIDSHAHLFDSKFNDDLDECIKRAKQENIKKIVLVGYDNESNYKSLELKNKYEIFEVTAGIHPSSAKDDYKKEMKDLEEFLKNNKVSAIGECGLDYYYVQDNKEIQKELFEFQIKLAIKYNLPLVIHTRDSLEDTYEMLSKYKGQIKGVMHCYSGDYEYAIKFIELGFYISLTGSVTYKNAKNAKEVAQNVDLEHLMIETDCPYLPPQEHRGKRNETSYLKYVCLEIADIKNISYDEVAKRTSENTLKLFNIKV